MQTLEKSLKKDKYPSFSSTLLDEIYRSIDNNKDGEKNSCNGNGNGVRQKINNPIEEDEEMGSLNRRSCLIDKWMEKKVNGKNFITTTREVLDFDNDPLYFSSSSVSSDSSSGSGGFSSSDTEFFSVSASASVSAAAKIKTTRTSCFATSWKNPKPIKTKIQENQNVGGTNQAQKDSALIKSRSRAVKIYTNLKNLKQPISPGGRLTSFINSLFTTNGSSEVKEGAKIERKCKSNQTSACSSATSFSRSCLSSKTQSTTTSRGSITSNTIHQNNDKRTVRFIVGEMESRRTQCGLKAYNDYKKDDFIVEKRSVVVEDGDDDDAASDCSSDLFEIDHLVLYGNKRFCEELPVYETTHLDKNLAIASGLVR